MDYRFQKHYTRAEARALLPQIRRWLRRLMQLRRNLQKQDEQLDAMRKDASDLGGELVNNWVRTMAEVKAVLLEFYHREIQIKDLERGLIDFPALMDGKEVFLCWEQAEKDIEYWHDLDAGYAGREPLGGPEEEC
jgi:hypothetical protein